ncbi:Fe(2+) transporter permease subunit FeoB [Rhodobacter capsulatus]|uniref:Ferrous iron transport protein B n=1 Tax=Rhodobacter capsulatus (strain ATCC BAA-309 / NBRC 16581 / SB1003) TaxID=272942 RepID=D5AKL5_RHOCB|nr:Fe(2+) transporter permease subunit FeoB [Rhodobacter capsulatus]ADE83857.1 ferrous iron transport protein B-1 [Rhodobacter capsulatus SB 1003]ETD03570.1 iron transporter FeoB [Rhodobacter capsulatus DE442]ETD80363.1 iron transporter FeoB [Rhodobacter capsulatus R121]ETE55630.1 iron transporter FeoB [Rhodobacter capsulatus Y262]MDS0925448.1 Fe(2+) transporter permease subunit FeoB [Rhodobacter capsulatus]
MKKLIVGTVGNPNCGKTTLFNALTGARQQVGNWPGVTVERKSGKFRDGTTEVELIDLPGTYSLDASEGDLSLDEQIARDFVAAREADVVLNIVDASNLERNLYLTAQLLEMKVPVVLAVNMIDIAEARGLKLDLAALSASLGCPVYGVVAAEGRGVAALKAGLAALGHEIVQPHRASFHAAPVQAAVAALRPQIEPLATARGLEADWAALSLLESDSLLGDTPDPALVAALTKARKDLTEKLGEDIDIVLADARYGFIGQVMAATIRDQRRVSETTSDRIDRVVLNRIFGVPIFLALMYLMFLFTIDIGGAFIDFFDIAAGAIFVDWLGNALSAIGTPDWLREILATGLGGGVQTVATFIPVVVFLFLFLSALEDSGYMARAAFVMDRAMRAIGLPGKAFVPLIVGFGCNVPAVMATRTIERHRDRLMTILMAPFMSCGARLPVYALFAAVFFPGHGGLIVFSLYMAGIGVAILSGLVMKSTLLSGPVTPFVMELPPYHVPTLKGVVIRTWEKTRNFVTQATKIIVPMVMVLNVLNSMGTDGSFGNADSRNSVLSEIGRSITPIFAPMGMTEENWPAAVGVFTGILAKEAVVGTLDALYAEAGKADAAAASASGAAEETPAEEEAPFSLPAALGEAVATVPANLGDALANWTDPLGLGEIEAQAGANATPTGQAMLTRFDGAAGAYAYLLFILLYFPCTAALAAMVREAGMGWTVFVAGWATAVGWILGTGVYQAARFSLHPGASASWLIGLALVSAAMFGGLRLWANRAERARTVAAQ